MKRLMDGCEFARSGVGLMALALWLVAGAAYAQEVKAKPAPATPAAAPAAGATGAAGAAEEAEPSEETASAQALPSVVGLRIANVTVAPRDAATATVSFDISWPNSWRYGNSFDAAWVFFKVRGAGSAGWQHGKLAADKVLNPAGFGQQSGTALEFVVPEEIGRAHV